MLSKRHFERERKKQHTTMLKALLTYKDQTIQYRNKENGKVSKETDQSSNKTFKLINKIVLFRHTTKGKNPRTILTT